MGRATVHALALALALSACGEPLVVLGDWPGILRVVVGIPDSFGENSDTLASSIKLGNPADIAPAADGVLYVLDGARVLSVTSAGRVRVLFDPALCLSNCLQTPAALALEPVGTLLIADPGAHRIWRFDPRARVLTAVAGTGQPGSSAAAEGTQALAAGISAPGGVARAADGAIYFSEGPRNIVRRIDANNALSTVAGTGIAGFSGDGGSARTARLNAPGTLTLAGSVLYISDIDNHRVRAVDLPTGAIRTVAGNGIAQHSGDGDLGTSASLNHPAGLAVADEGRTLFISDSFNQRVRALNLVSGTIVTLIGTGSPTFTGNGLSGGETSLRVPGGVAVSPEDFLYVADTGHRVVWRTALRQ
jgi:sugar lactone lactonase YvrE